MILKPPEETGDEDNDDLYTGEVDDRDGDEDGDDDDDGDGGNEGSRLLTLARFLSFSLIDFVNSISLWSSGHNRADSIQPPRLVSDPRFVCRYLRRADCVLAFASHPLFSPMLSSVNCLYISLLFTFSSFPLPILLRSWVFHSPSATRGPVSAIPCEPKKQRWNKID